MRGRPVPTPEGPVPWDDFARDFQAQIIRGQPFVVTLQGHVAWIVMATIQKAMQIPDKEYSLQAKAVLRPLGQELERMLTVTPALVRFAAETWKTPDAEPPRDLEFERDFTRHMVNGPTIDVGMSAEQAWQVVGMCQIVVRMLPCPPQVRIVLSQVARQLQKMLGRTPTLATVLEAGWDSRWDQRRRER